MRANLPGTSEALCQHLKGQQSYKSTAFAPNRPCSIILKRVWSKKFPRGELIQRTGREQREMPPLCSYLETRGHEDQARAVSLYLPRHTLEAQPRTVHTAGRGGTRVTGLLWDRGPCFTELSVSFNVFSQVFPLGHRGWVSVSKCVHHMQTVAVWPLQHPGNWGLLQESSGPMMGAAVTSG